MAGHRRHRSRHRGGPRDDIGGYSEGEGSQMPSSSRMSYNEASYHHTYHPPRGFSPGPYDLPTRPRGSSSRSNDLPPPPREYSSRSDDFPPPPPLPRVTWTRERSRSATPPPPKGPSASYLVLAKQPPTRVDDPIQSRKLLVLDLNGTLLHRSPNGPRARHERGSLLPRLRPVHPRPYMLAFRSFLFAPETKLWLDVMVWSSAQPHSVDDMVDKCFGRDRQKMIAVWARDTLGLSNEHYHRKVQTVKDLEKPWSVLSPQTVGDAPSSSHPSISSTPHSPSHPSDESVGRPPENNSPQVHSVLTTLLLDDSPLKAELQPFNHVCIREYTAQQRLKDVESLHKEQDWIAAVEARRELDDFAVDIDPAPSSTSHAASDAPSSPERADASPERSSYTDSDVSKKRKRKEKKLQKRVALLEQFGDGEKPEISYDETLLAVIGVLDEIKIQANVAAWIRSGGLWGPHGPPASREPKLAAVEDGDAAAPEVDERATPQSDDSDLSVEDDANASGAGKTRKREKKRQRMRGRSADAEEVADVGNDETTAVPLEEEEGLIAEPVAEEQKMWFEDPEVFSYWVTRGRRALEELGIAVEHGIDR